jgi:hypothetical protein
VEAGRFIVFGRDMSRDMKGRPAGGDDRASRGLGERPVQA